MNVIEAKARATGWAAAGAVLLLLFSQTCSYLAYASRGEPSYHELRAVLAGDHRLWFEVDLVQVPVERGHRRVPLPATWLPPAGRHAPQVLAFIDGEPVPFFPDATLVNGSHQGNWVYYRTAATRMLRVVCEAGPPWGFQTFEMLSPIAGDPKRMARGEVVTARARDWLSQNRDSDFFLFLNYMDVHPPLVPPAERNRFHPPAAPIMDVDGDIYASGDRDRSLSGEFAPSRPYRERLRSLYDAEMNYLDSQIGALIAFVRSDARLARAAIVITSDHGQELGESGLLGHGLTVNEPEVRIPLVIHTGRDRGLRWNLGSLVDVHATILRICGVRPRQGTPGADLLDQKPPDARAGQRDVHSSSRLLPHYRRHLRPPLDQDTVALYEGEYKLTLGEAGYRRLSRVVGLAREEGVSPELEGRYLPRMLPRVERILARGGHAAREGIPTLSPEVLERLRALGYTGP